VPAIPHGLSLPVVAAQNAGMFALTELSTPLVGPASLTVARGACVAIEGPSGAGKSLLLRAVADLDPAEGEARLNGERRDSMPAPVWRRRVALVPAESGWWTDRVGDHFNTRDDPGALLAAVGLADALDWRVSRLSSGERHRLAIVRALAGQPSVLLLDEPTATLDAAATAQVEAVLMQALAQGIMMIVVTHDAAQPARLSADRYRMAEGRLRRCATDAP
jgi:ABC-type iron transport system FetAB ATPase subunit